MVDDLPFGRKSGAFPETRWSALLELGDPSNPAAGESMNRLIQQYWMPVYHYIRSLRPVGPHEAEDLTQQFFTMLLDRGSLTRMERDRGSFRGFLKTALRYFLIDQDRTARSRAPRDGACVFAYDQAEAAWNEARGRAAPTPEEAFDREWARGVLKQAVSRLKAELGEEGKALYFTVFSEIWSDRPLDDPATGSSYAELARKHAIRTSDVGNYLRVVRQRLRAILQDIVSGYLGPGENPEDEVRFILSR